MPKEIILMEDVDGLGLQGEVVSVAEGYARNYLLPRSLAAPVTSATRKTLESRRAEVDARRAALLAEAETLAASLETASCTIPVKSGPDGKLFGSVKASDIVENLAGLGIKVEKGQLHLEQPLRELGVFKVPVKINAQVTATLKVWVVEE